jgi:thiopeptide-type bacteriocin biosynthesis protein
MKPGPHIQLADMTTAVDAILDDLTSPGRLAGWRRTHYEPETFAFGGPAGIDIAHALFCADSRHVLAFLRQRDPLVGRRELSVLLCTTLFRATGQEWFEAADIWHRVTQMRHVPGDMPAGWSAKLLEDMHLLLGSDARSSGTLFGTGGPLAFAGAWAAEFDRAGHALAAAANDGTLERGTRDILAHAAKTSILT